jgi:uncharacterized protein (DUF4415 family)
MKRNAQPAAKLRPRGRSGLAHDDAPQKTAENVGAGEIGSHRPAQSRLAFVAVEEAASTKVQLTIRVDRDDLEWYRKKGRGYQTRINQLLRAYIEAHPKEVA